MARVNEATGFVLLVAAVFLTLTLISYYPQDPSWNTAAAEGVARNLGGVAGSHVADLLLQSFGLAAFVFPALLVLLAWHWFRSAIIDEQWARLAGAALLFLSVSATLGLWPEWRLYESTVPLGGLLGSLLAGWLLQSFNLAGSVLLTSTCLLVSMYLLTSFTMYAIPEWASRPSWLFAGLRLRWNAWLVAHEERRQQEQMEREARRAAEQAAEEASEEAPAFARRRQELAATQPADGEYDIPIRTFDEVTVEAADPAAQSLTAMAQATVAADRDLPWESAPAAAGAGTARARAAAGASGEPAVVEYTPPAPSTMPSAKPGAAPGARHAAASAHTVFHLPETALLNEPDPRSPHDTQELKEIAVRIKGKFEEFNVLGSVTQINPGPVVTTFEFKPEAGIKYSRITTLSEDLCLGLQAESILIERIPGKPTVGIEVPNTRREVISLRQILESDEFRTSPSKLTIPLGKDISGRIKVTALETMPHLLIAGSTGSGKSVMLNALIMSILYKSSPQDVRMILVDPKRVEMGPYEDIPHLLTPVITDPRKATNALRNAVLEMERRLKLLASQGVRNIDQFNKKVNQLLAQPRSLFADQEQEGEELAPLPYILIIIDELADLMMLERGNVEESITRLAQMARAVGMHLVVATQRPSVDVITGLIKANFPARISFRVATRVDSRTILDNMGAEHLLGKGDMLFLPPGSSRQIRVHAAYVTESEIGLVTDFWKKQARPDYDQSYLIAPPEEGEEGDAGEFDDFNDPAYADAVRVVLEVGKASTSTLQRRLRLGYGRAARILDKMHHEGIIGPPDGSRPREVLKRPEWLDEVEAPAR